MDNKGQVSVELLFLIVVILIIISSVTIPLVSTTIGSSMAVSQVSDAKSAVESIGNAVNIVNANGPGAKRTLSVYIPKTTILTTSNYLLGMTISGIAYNNSNNVSQSSKYVNTTIDSNIASTLSLNKGWQKIQVYWNPASNTITITTV